MYATSQRQPFDAAYSKLGHLLALASIGVDISQTEINEIIGLLQTAHRAPEQDDEPEAVKVARKLRAMAENPWVRRPTDEEIRGTLALGANEIERLMQHAQGGG